MNNQHADLAEIQDAPAAMQEHGHAVALPDQERQPTDDVYVAENALDLLRIGDTQRINTKPMVMPGERRDLDQVVHAVLVIGLTISGALMISGLILGLVLHRELPEAMPAITEIPGRILSLRPSGFLALGLLVLIATPILRVIGSIAAFVYEHDWRYTAITSVVLLVLLLSLLIGKGG